MRRHKLELDLLPSAPNFSFEQVLWDQAITQVAGIDEAGRGALAGPVAAAVVIFPAIPDLAFRLKGVRDSKQMTASQRQGWAEQIRHMAQAWGVGLASHQEIDTLGILPATRLAAKRAVQALADLPQHLLLDFLELPDIALPQTPLVKGDRRSLSIAAASILAKTDRDMLMRQYDLHYPGYGFDRHKGYATRFHYQAIQALGPCPVHRRTFNLTHGW